MQLKLFTILILGVFLISFASASILDSKIEFKDKTDYQLGDKLIKYNKLWEKYRPIKIASLFGLGNTKAQIALTEHTEICGQNCFSTMEIYLANDGVLIDDNKFYTLQEDKWIEQDIRWSKFQYWGLIDDYETQCTKKEIVSSNGTYTQETCNQVKVGTHEGWVNYNLGDKVKAGNYKVKLLGEKKPSRTVDWRIETQGKVIDELAVWGAEWIWNNGSTDTTNNPDSFSSVSNAFDEDNSTHASRAYVNANSNDIFYLGKTFSSKEIRQVFYKAGYTYSTPHADSTVFTLKLQTYNGTTWSDESTLETGGEGSNTYSGYYNLSDIVQGLRLSFSFAADNPNDATYTAYAYTIEYETKSEAYITLNSPTDNYISDSNEITFNATAEVTGGATLTNMSLWTNESGNWELNETKNITKTEDIYTIPLTSAYKNSSILNTEVFWIIIVANGYDTTHRSYVIFHYNDTTTYQTPTIDRGLGEIGNHTNINPEKKVTYFESFIVSVPGGKASLLSGYAWGNNYFSATNISFNRTITDDIIWNIQACDSDGDCGFAPSNYSLFLDTNPPTISITSPNETFNYLKVNNTLNLNVTMTDTNLEDCWYNYNGTNQTFNCTTGVQANETFLQEAENFNITVYANDSVGNENSETSTWGYKVFENSRTLNSSSYETQSELFQIDVTDGVNLTAVVLDYNGTEYSTTKSGTIYSKTLDIPIGVQNRSIRWKFTYAGDSIYSDYSYQNILETVWTLCNASYTDDYLNISFKDESTLSLINGTIQTSIFNYYLGSGTSNKTYTYSTSGEELNYKFCATPNQTFKVDPYINYLGDGYPNRIWEPELQTYTSNVTEKLLYLLSSTDGIYVTFITATSFNTAIPGVDITISRDISGDTTTVSQGITDSAGSFTAWLNPNYDHVITATKTGYTTNTQTIRPTQTSYTLVMSTGANEYTYVSDYAGLKWFVFPSVGVRSSTNSTDFGFNITARNGNLVNCKIELLNQDKTIVLASAISSSANGSSCEVLVPYSMSSTYPKVKGRLLIDMGEGYQLLEDDAYWAYLAFNSTGMTFTDWFNGLTDADLSYFNNNDQHREYTYILLFFLFVMIVCAIMNYAGWDIQNPGGMIFLVGTMVWIASVPGFLTLNYISPYLWIDKYFVAGVYSLFMIGYTTRNLT